MPGGRPTKYDEAYHPEHAYKLTLLGFTNDKLAEFFDIAESTLHLWREEHPEFSDAVTRGKEEADANVAVGFYKRATGYEYDSEKLMTVSIGGDAGSQVERHPITVHVPPDPGAALNWLKNRQPHLWRDKKTLEMEDEEGESLYFPVVRIYGAKPEGE